MFEGKIGNTDYLLPHAGRLSCLQAEKLQKKGHRSRPGWM